MTSYFQVGCVDKPLINLLGDPFTQALMGHGIRAVTQRELVAALRSRGFIASDRLASVMEIVDRRKFVNRGDAYANEPCRINKHSVSTPQFHAQLLSLVVPRCGPGFRVADIGTGTGYLAAVLAELGCNEVVATEADEEMHKLAESNLQSYENLNLLLVRPSDPIIPGYVGKFDSIIVSPSFSSEDAAFEALEPKLNDEGVAVFSSRGSDTDFRQLMTIRKLRSGLVIDRLMTVACEMITHNQVTKEDPKAWLERWKEHFQARHGRAPRKEDVMDDKSAKDMFQRFSASRKYQP